ncbi:MAG: zinc-ribbon domain-containing protein, partial [Gammaproteobacteria bacterium]|nr:zinc-ribbon domain-containing protein [Gammaproteobacteria bacterium]
MYTQCPECHIAFRVTARVLQQADGRVRCGNCNHAFNAIHYLSEEMPSAPDTDDVPTEGVSRDELAETSRRLLRTLDELAGPGSVRIEDTGVEWRVLDEAAMDDDLEDQPPPDALRYDDNSPLPEDLGDVDDSAWSTPAPRHRDEEFAASPVTFGNQQGDIALSDPEDWTDILEEVTDSAVDSLEVEEQLVAIHSELSAIEDDLTDEVPALDEEVPEDFPLVAGATDVDFVVADDGDLSGDEPEKAKAEDNDSGIFGTAAEIAENEEGPDTELDDEPVAKPLGHGDHAWLETLSFDEDTPLSVEDADDDWAEDEIDAGGIEVTEEQDDEPAIEVAEEPAEEAPHERRAVA